MTVGFQLPGFYCKAAALGTEEPPILCAWTQPAKLKAAARKSLPLSGMLLLCLDAPKGSLGAFNRGSRPPAGVQGLRSVLKLILIRTIDLLLELRWSLLGLPVDSKSWCMELRTADVGVFPEGARTLI